MTALRQQSKAEWGKSRTWLARAAFLLVGAFIPLIASYAFKPLLALTAILGVASFYSMGRYGWHVQRAAVLRRRAGGMGHRKQLHPVLRVMSDWPIPVGLGIAAFWMVVGVAVVVLLQRH